MKSAAIELIPAIDLINGQCVRLTKGDYNQKKVYSNNPVDIAKEFESLGFRRLQRIVQIREERQSNYCQREVCCRYNSCQPLQTGTE